MGQTMLLSIGIDYSGLPGNVSTAGLGGGRTVKKVVRPWVMAWSFAALHDESSRFVFHARSAFILPMHVIAMLGCRARAVLM